MELTFAPVDEPTFPDIPAPSAPGARCQTCDYWERLEGTRAAPPEGATDADARSSLKRGRLVSAAGVAGPYGMVAYAAEPEGDRRPVGYAQFGPISAYPRAQVIRERYPDLPQSPPPWVITCLQVPAGAGAPGTREEIGRALLEATCGDLDRRGVTAVEAYPERAAEAWLPSPGPAALYVASGFERVAGDDRYPVYRRELTGETDAAGWDELLRRAQPGDEQEEWPFPPPGGPTEEDLFRLPQRPRRPNPFGDD